MQDKVGGSDYYIFIEHFLSLGTVLSSSITDSVFLTITVTPHCVVTAIDLI